jgi:hypothetical protein
MAPHYKNEPFEETISWRMMLFQLRRLCGDIWNGYVNDVCVRVCCKQEVFRHSIAAVTLRERNKVTRVPKASVKSYSAYRHITDNIPKTKSKEIS